MHINFYFQPLKPPFLLKKTFIQNGGSLYLVIGGDSLSKNKQKGERSTETIKDTSIVVSLYFSNNKRYPPTFSLSSEKRDYTEIMVKVVFTILLS